MKRRLIGLFVAGLLFNVLFALAAFRYSSRNFDRDHAFLLFMILDLVRALAWLLALVLLFTASVGTCAAAAVSAVRAARGRHFLVRTMLVLIALTPLLVPAWVPYSIVTKDPLHKSARAGDLKKVGALLAAGADPNALDERSVAPLGYAVAGRHAEVAEALLRHGADPNFCSPLETAARNGDVRTMKALLAHGANPNRRLLGNTPLDAAASSGNPEAVKLLLESGAKPTTPKPLGPIRPGK